MTSEPLSRMNYGMRKTSKSIRLAAPRGFCAGVDRAVKIVEAALDKFGAPVYVRHEIVHNKTVVDALAEKGAIFVEELHEAPIGAPVVFSAHGVSRAVVEEANNRKMITIDATCPLVTKVHIEAKRHVLQQRHILLIGHAGHPEVEGTMGQVDDDAITLIETADDARNVIPPNDCELAFATQTTLSIEDTAEIISILQFRFPKITGPRGEDICYATTNRQNAVKAIAQGLDLMIVVGAQNSSNSKRLVEVALRAGASKAALVKDKDDVDWKAVETASLIGISAGASAPEKLVKDLIAEIQKRYDVELDEKALLEENVTFKLPSVLNSRVS